MTAPPGVTSGPTASAGSTITPNSCSSPTTQTSGERRGITGDYPRGRRANHGLLGGAGSRPATPYRPRAGPGRKGAGLPGCGPGYGSAMTSWGYTLSSEEHPPQVLVANAER